MTSLIQKGLSATLVGVSLMAASMGAQATGGLPLTLPTANIDAKSTFNFSDDAKFLMDGMGVNVSALGNTKKVGGANLSFDMPVTEVSVAISLFPPALNPVAGEAMGSALGFTRAGTSGFALANFGLDFKRNVLQADFITAGGTTQAVDIFNFKVDQGLKISMDGGLSLNMSMADMHLTKTAIDRFGSALNLPGYATAALDMINFGSLLVDIDPSLRFGVSNKSFTAASMASAVPEAPQAIMMMLGLVGLASISHRRRRD